MKRGLLTALNTLSIIPILIWPLLLAFGFDNPYVPTVLVLITLIVLIGYPFFTINFIILSRKRDSLLLASYAFIPILLFICIILIEKYYLSM